MKRLACTALLTVLVLTGCDATSVEPAAFAAAAGNPDGVPVVGVARFSGAAYAVPRHAGPGNTSGTCHEGGAWDNGDGELMSPVPHPQCLSLSHDNVGIDIAFSEEARLVETPSGNRHLHFRPDGQTGGARSIAYLANLDRTTAMGVLLGTDPSGGVWRLELSQVAGPGPTGFPGRAFYGLVACSQETPALCAHGGEFTW